MKLFKNKEEFHKALIIFSIVAASILFAFGLYKLSALWNVVKKILGFFTPFYIGFAIAYLLSPALRFFETKVFHKIKKGKHRRTLSLLLVYLLFAVALFLILYFVLPSLLESISSLIAAIPEGVKKLTAFLQNLTERYPQMNEFYNQNSDKITELITQGVQSLVNAIGSLLPSVVNMTVSITGTVANIVIGIIISVYMLLSKEKLIAQCKKLLFGLSRKNTAEDLIRIGHIANKKMSSYIVGQVSISLIDAIIVYIVSAILKFPYPVLLAVIVGLFNLIPFFGSVIGCIPCLLIILIQSPIKALYFLIFFIVLQQIEGNILGPKIQSKQLNISPIWIIFAILLFGGLFGFWGLLIGVPLFSVIMVLFTQFVNERLKQKGMSSDTDDYISQQQT